MMYVSTADVADCFHRMRMARGVTGYCSLHGGYARDQSKNEISYGRSSSSDYECVAYTCVMGFRKHVLAMQESKITELGPSKIGLQGIIDSATWHGPQI